MNKLHRTLLAACLLTPAFAFAHGEEVLLIPFLQLLVLIAFIVFISVATLKRRARALLGAVFIITTFLVYVTFTDINNIGLICFALVLVPTVSVCICYQLIKRRSANHNPTNKPN